MRRVLLAASTLVLLAGCGAHPAPPASEIPITSVTSTTSHTVPYEDRCPAEGVRLLVAGVEAAMGLRVLTVQLTNCGSEPYTVHGYPSVRLFDEEREPVEVVVRQGAGGIATVPAFDVPPRPVTLRPGEHARTGLLWRNLVTDSTVAATTAVRLELASASGRPWQPVPLGAPAVTIDLGNTGELGVRAWTKE